MPSSDSRRYPLRFEVVAAQWLTSTMRRLVFAADVLAVRRPGEEDTFERFLERDGGFTDRYIKFVFAQGGAEYPEPLDLEHVREMFPREQWPVLRTYTVRWIDRAARTIAVDFVVHGDRGIAGPWAAEAVIGDRIAALGPGGKYAPLPEPDWHLVVGDDAGVPAATAALEAMPAGRLVHAFLEVDGPDDEQPIASAADLRLTWLHRAGAEPGSTSLLADAVKAMIWPDGRAQAFVHGEAALLKSLRSYLRDERVIAADDLSISGYWRAGSSEDRFREWKAAQKAAAEAEKPTSPVTSPTQTPARTTR